MKLLLSLALIIAVNCNAQNCKEIDSMNSFHGVRFGSDFLKGAMRKAEGLGEQGLYSINRVKAMTDNDLYKATSFDNYTFDDLFISCNKKNQVYSFILSTPLTNTDSVELKNKEMPKSFVMLFDKMRSLFGDYTKEVIKNDSLRSYMGVSYNYIWECQKIRMECSITYGGLAFINKIHLMIVDIELERKAQLENIK